MMQAYTHGFTKEDLIAIHLYTKTGITPCGSLSASNEWIINGKLSSLYL
ncbi:hypothetical protein [Spiroplasma endosymbiont of Clivina fossor]